MVSLLKQPFVASSPVQQPAAITPWAHRQFVELQRKLAEFEQRITELETPTFYYALTAAPLILSPTPQPLGATDVVESSNLQPGAVLSGTFYVQFTLDAIGSNAQADFEIGVSQDGGVNIDWRLAYEIGNTEQLVTVAYISAVSLEELPNTPGSATSFWLRGNDTTIARGELLIHRIAVSGETV